MQDSGIFTLDSVLDCVGIGRANVDLLANVTDDFLNAHDVIKGGDTFVSTENLMMLAQSLPEKISVAGGAAANCMSGIAALGGKAAFIGRCGNDKYGQIFRDSFADSGVVFTAPPAPEPIPTSLCIALVTPDGERSFVLANAASEQLAPENLDPHLLGRARIIHADLTCLSWHSGQQTLIQAAAYAARHGRRLSLNLPVPELGEKYRSDIDMLLENGGIIFGNLEEYAGWLGVSGHTDIPACLLGKKGIIAVMTCGADGAVITANGTVLHQPASPIAQLVDTTGAGDQFAAGFLYGISQGRSPAEAGKIGAESAARIVMQAGARPIQKASLI